MHPEDTLVSALVRALEADPSPQAMRRAVAALRTARGVSNSRAYAILVRAKAGLPAQPIESTTVETSSVVPSGAAPARSPVVSQPPLLAS